MYTLCCAEGQSCYTEGSWKNVESFNAIMRELAAVYFPGEFGGDLWTASSYAPDDLCGVFTLSFDGGVSHQDSRNDDIARAFCVK